MIRLLPPERSIDQLRALAASGSSRFARAAQTELRERITRALTATVQPGPALSGGEALGPSRLTGPDEAPGTNSKSQAA